MTDAVTSTAVPRVAIGFPGQGGDWRAGVATLEAVPAHPLVRALADRLGTGTWQELDPLDTRNAQPVTYVAGLVGDAAPHPPPLVAVAIGHSLGEITAAAWAGAIDPIDGLDLMVARGRIGHELHRERPGAMVAVMRWDGARVEWLRRRVLAEVPGVLEVAVVNSDTQRVLSGDALLVERALELANAEGAVARRLPIGGAYHSPLLVPGVDRFERQVHEAVQRDPRVPVVSSTSPRPHVEAADLAESLVRSLVLPVDWPAAVAAAAGAGAERLLDAGPGDTLTRLARFLPDLPASEP